MSMTPIIFQTTSQGERAYDVFSWAMKSRTIWLKEPIHDDVANIVSAQLSYLDAADRRKPIDLYINSPGGIVTGLLAMYDTMQFITAPVRTLCIGEAYSAGAVLLLSGSAGHRAALPHARIMIHQPSGGSWGTITDQEIALREGIRLKDIINEIVAKHTKQPMSEVIKAMDRDHWMSATEALEFGIIDEILSKRTYYDLTAPDED